MENSLNRTLKTVFSHKQFIKMKNLILFLCLFASSVVVAQNPIVTVKTVEVVKAEPTTSQVESFVVFKDVLQKKVVYTYYQNYDATEFEREIERAGFEQKRLEQDNARNKENKARYEAQKAIVTEYLKANQPKNNDQKRAGGN